MDRLGGDGSVERHPERRGVVAGWPERPSRGSGEGAVVPQLSLPPTPSLTAMPGGRELEGAGWTAAPRAQRPPKVQSKPAERPVVREAVPSDTQRASRRVRPSADVERRVPDPATPSVGFGMTSGAVGSRARARGGRELVSSLPLQGDDPNEERDDDGHRDGLWQPVGACDRDKDDARDDHEERETPATTETAQASVVWTSITHGAAILGLTDRGARTGGGWAEVEARRVRRSRGVYGRDHSECSVCGSRPIASAPRDVST